MTREELAARVAELGEAYEGEAFVEAVQRLDGTLDDEEREVLGAVLLERAGVFERAIHERLYSKGWFRRQLDKLDEGTPRSR